MPRLRPLPWLALLALAAVTLLWRLGSIGLVGPDEPRYAEIAAEMATAHAYVTPRLMGQPWFEKPVLYYWLAAADFRLLGVGDGAARLPNALLGLALCGGLILFLYRERGERAALVGGLVALSSAFVIGYGRAAALDMTLTAPLALAQFALLAWLRHHAAGRRAAAGRWLATAAALLGLATLAKGPVALVLAGGGLLGYALWARRPAWALATLRPGPLALYLAVAAPWYLLVARRHPDFLRIFFLQHNLERFSSGVFHHAQPFWYYLPILLLAIFPWSALAALPWIEWRRNGWPAPSDGAPSTKSYLLAWVLVTVGFFSLSHSKLPGYILPALPALVALIALAAVDLGDRLPRWPLQLSVGGAAAVLLAFPVWLATRLAQAGAPHRPAVLAVGFSGLHVVTLAVLAWLLWRGSRPLLWGTTAAAMALAVLAGTGRYAAPLDLLLSARPLAGVLAAQPIPALPSYPETTVAGGDYSDGEVPAAFAQSCPLWGWRLRREARYGAEFYLHRVLPELAGTASWPPHAWVVINAWDGDLFSRAAQDAHRDLTPVAVPAAAPWRVYRVDAQP